ncbi:DUF4037 domain-containing protein [Haladaptatus sp. T7]|uniref:DUF4037 domain-containing protein n=1 Tax=Haladaptatus sp. T7 TaxID=2029368 RepID=UPI0021A251E9|nr:DUF4037 domain-containing protein [Haladaptatus sp. T7]GKZ12872.1 hypothetical protein HAL_07530 [Haladaptatus sp. T7]
MTYLRDAAAGLADEIVAPDDVLGVLLHGSVALGHADDHSDVELRVVATPDAVAARDSTGETRQHDGVFVELDWTTLDRIEADLADWDDDTALYVHANADVLADPTGVVTDLLGRYDDYPATVREEKCFSYWYHATGNAPLDSGLAFRRDDPLTAELSLRRAVEGYMALPFLLDGRFVPYRKWRRAELSTLSWTPTAFESRLETVVLGDDAEEKQAVVSKLMTDFERRLLDFGLSERRVLKPYLFEPEYDPV